VNFSPDWLVYVFASLVATFILVYVFLPSSVPLAGEETKTRLTYLQERKETIYENLRDLNFEHKSGKFTEADFESMHSSMEAEATRVLAEIDALESVRA